MEEEALPAGGSDSHAEPAELVIAEGVRLSPRPGAVDLGLAEGGMGHGFPRRAVAFGKCNWALLHSGACNREESITISQILSIDDALASVVVAGHPREARPFALGVTSHICGNRQ